MEIFVFGLIFGLVMTPVLDGITSLILSFFEMIKSYFALKIATHNQLIEDLSAETPIRKIGFDLGEEVENDDL